MQAHYCESIDFDYQHEQHFELEFSLASPSGGRTLPASATPSSVIAYDESTQVNT